MTCTCSEGLLLLGTVLFGMKDAGQLNVRILGGFTVLLLFLFEVVNIGDHILLLSLLLQLGGGPLRKLKLVTLLLLNGVQFDRLIVEYFVARLANGCSVVVVVLRGQLVQFFIVLGVCD